MPHGVPGSTRVHDCHDRRFAPAALIASALVFLVSTHAQAWTVSISANKSSPQAVGTQITLTATPNGAWATPTYAFLISSDGGSTWTTLRD